MLCRLDDIRVLLEAAEDLRAGLPPEHRHRGVCRDVHEPGDRQDDADWTRVRDGVPLHGCTNVWRISVKPGDGPAVIAALPEGSHALMDWGGGLIWAGHDSVDAAAHGHIQSRVASLGGHATLMKGVLKITAAK